MKRDLRTVLNRAREFAAYSDGVLISGREWRATDGQPVHGELSPVLFMRNASTQRLSHFLSLHNAPHERIFY